MEDKENEPQQERVSKLAVEPPVQKPRRSVLKEFDPFAPDSPCPPKAKSSEKIDEEDEIYEDAETSLKRFGILLIPDLRANNQDNPNDTFDMSYVEASESFSESERLVLFDKTSSEEDFEFNNCKKHKNSKYLVDNFDSNMLNISSDMDVASGLTDGNIMVDSLERMCDVSDRLNSTIENIESPVILSKTKPIEAQEPPINVSQNISELTDKVESRVVVELSQIKGNEPEELGSMIDSLELPNVQENTPISDSIFEKNEAMLTDSLEILKSEEGLDILNTEETGERAISSVAKEKDKASHDILANGDHKTACKSDANLDKTFESLFTDTKTSEASLFQNSDTDTPIKNQKSSEPDSAFENVSALGNRTLVVKNSNEIITSGSKNSSENVDGNKVVEVPSLDSVESKAELKSDQINSSSGNVLLNNTFESLSLDASKPDQFQSHQINASNGNVEPSEIFERSSLESLEYKANQLQHEQINTSSVNVEHNQTFESPSNNVQSKMDQLHSDVVSVNIELNETFESPSSNNVEPITDLVQSDEISTSDALSSENVESNTDQRQRDQINTSNVNLEGNQTFDGTSVDNVQPKSDQLQSDEMNTSKINLKGNQTFDGISLDNVLSKTDQFLSDHINTSNSNLEGNQTFDGTSLDNVQSKPDQFQSEQIMISNVNIELNKAFETPSSNNVESNSDQCQNDQVNTSLTTPGHTEIQVVERDATADDEMLNKTVDSNENVKYTEWNLTETIDYLNQTKESIQQVVASDTDKETDCDTENTPCNKTLETLSDKTDTLITENLNNQGLEVLIDTEVNGTVESCKQEAMIAPNSSQSTANDTQNVQDRSVSLKDIDIDTTRDNIGKDNTKHISSELHSFLPNCSEDSNSKFLTEEQAAESHKIMDALAQSLNQTIDVEESAIADDINSSKSTNTSGELTEEKLNITIENVNERLPTHESVIGGEEDLKSEEKANRTSIKTLERKATEEFEDLERQFNEKAENTGSCIQQELGENTQCTVGEQCNKDFQRQDTQEFEVLEREYLENAKNSNVCDPITVNNSINNNEAKQSNINGEEKVMDDIESKLINRHTRELDDLKSDCTANLPTCKEYADDLKLNGEKTAQNLHVAANVEETDNKNANAFEPGVKESINGDDLMQETDSCMESVIEHVKVRVSGNICNANSVSSKFEQIGSKTRVEEPIMGINLKYDLTNVKEDLNVDFENKSLNNIVQNTTKLTVNDNVPISTKTDSGVTKEVSNSTNDENDQLPKVNESIVRPKHKPECRPSTRSLRNQTQVIDNPVVINNDPSREMNQETNDKSDELIQKYKSTSEDLKEQVDKLQTEINQVKDKNKRMDKYILTCALDTEAERDKVIKLKKVLEQCELTLASQNEDLRRLKEEEEKNTKGFNSLEMAFADVFEKYEKAKTVIRAYKKNEEILQKNIQCAEDQLVKLEAKCSVTKEQYSEKLRTVQEQVVQEKEKYRQDIAKLQAMVKRLEIKSSCLETSLRQKTDECRALSTLCDDITGKPM